MKTRMTELYGTEYPIQCGGMMWLATPELAAAVSNAGALGNVTSGIYNSADELRAAIDRTRELTSKPFAINITTMPSIRLSVELLQQYFKVCCEKKVAAIEIAGAPVNTFLGPEYIPMAKEAGVKVVHKVGAVKHAEHAQKVGYDAVIACGFEEAGFPHQDNVGVMVLLPKIVESVDIPVIAAGGMVDGKTLAAVLALGGEGMMMASRFVATKECKVHPNVHKLLLEKTEKDTSLQLRGFLAQWGLQVRALRNEFTRKVEEIEARGGGPEEYIPLMSAELAKKAWDEGECDDAMLTFGQSIGRIYDIPTVAELVERIVKQAEEALRTSLERVHSR